MNSAKKQVATPEILLSTTDYFKDTVEEALYRLKIKTYPFVTQYLVSLLDHYALTDNLYNVDDQTGRRSIDTRAEMFLRAQAMEGAQKQEALKRLGDSSLYISGFFGDSLKRKVVDIDYYADIGVSAYGVLADSVNEDLKARIFDEFSNRFIEFVDVLTYISQKAMTQNNNDLLRLYERYIKTGSEMARDQLIELGLLNDAVEKRKSTKS